MYLDDESRGTDQYDESHHDDDDNHAPTGDDDNHRAASAASDGTTPAGFGAGQSRRDLYGPRGGGDHDLAGRDGLYQPPGNQQ